MMMNKANFKSENCVSFNMYTKTLKTQEVLVVGQSGGGAK